MSFGGLGGGSGGSGGGGTIRYAIIIDDSQVNSKLSSIEQRLNQLNNATRSVGTGLTSLNTGMQTLGSTTQTTVTDLDAINNNFQTINSSTQSAGTGLGNLNSNMQTFGSTTKGTKTDLDAINNNWQSMESGAKNSANSVDALNGSLGNAKGGLTQYNTLSGEVVTNSQNMGDATQTTGQKIKQFGGFMKNNALAVGVFTSGIIGLVSSYTQLQKVQLSAQIANTNAEKAQQRVVKAQEALSKAVEKYGADSKEAQIKAKDLALAQETAGNKAAAAALKNQQANESLLAFISGFTQNAVLVASAGVQMATGLKDLAPMIKGIGSSFKGLGPAVIAFSGPLLIAVVGIYALLAALKAVSNVNKIVTKEFGNQTVQMSILEATWLKFKVAVGQATEEDKKRLAQFEKQTNTITTQSKDVQQAIAEAFMDPIPESFEQNMKQAIQNIMNIKPATATAGEGLDTLGQQADEFSTGFQDNTVDEQLAFAKAQDAIKQKAIETQDKLNEENIQSQLDWAKFQDARKKKAIETQDALNEENIKAQLDWAKFQDAMKQKAIETQDKINEENIQAQLNFAKFQDAMKQKAIETQDKINEENIKSQLEWAKMLDARRKEWQKFADDFNKNDLDLAGIFKFDKKFDSDKIAKKMIESLPNKLEKRMKLDLKMETKDQATEEGIQKFLQRVLDANPEGGYTWDPDLHINDKSATEIAKDLIKNIDKNTQDPDLKAFRAKLKAAVDGSAGDSEIAQILADHVADAPPIPVVIVADKTTGTNIQSGIDKGGPYVIEAQFDFMNDAPKPHSGKHFVRDKSSPNGIGYWVDDKTGHVAGKNYKTNDEYNTSLGHGEQFERWRSYQGMSPSPYYGGGGGTEGLRGFEQFINPVNDVPGWGGLGGPDRDQFELLQMSGGLGGIAPGSNQTPQFDIMARQIDQLTKNLNLYARAIVTVTQDNNLFARTITQITSNLNLIARAIVQVTSNNNLFARTIVTVTKDNNLLARTIVTTTKDYNLLARATVTTTKDNNQFAKTIVTITKDNNQLAKTTVTVTKDYNQLARATVQNTKNNNTFARTISQVEKNLKSAAEAAKKYASALRSIPSSGGGGGFSGFPGGGFASGGDFITHGPQMILVGESGREHVHIEPLTTGNKSGSGSGGTVNQTINLRIAGSDLINERNLSKRIKLTVGENRDKFG